MHANDFPGELDSVAPQAGTTQRRMNFLGFRFFGDAKKHKVHKLIGYYQYLMSSGRTDPICGSSSYAEKV
jgi:hypothetical protein